MGGLHHNLLCALICAAAAAAAASDVLARSSQHTRHRPPPARQTGQTLRTTCMGSLLVWKDGDCYCLPVVHYWPRSRFIVAMDPPPLALSASVLATAQPLMGGPWMARGWPVVRLAGQHAELEPGPGRRCTIASVTPLAWEKVPRQRKDVLGHPMAMEGQSLLDDPALGWAPSRTTGSSCRASWADSKFPHKRRWAHRCCARLPPRRHTHTGERRDMDRPDSRLY